MKDQAGFTLMETLCAIALLLIFAAATGALMHNSRRITGIIGERSSRHYRQLHIERLIREAIEDVSIPYWSEDTLGIAAAREAIEKTLLDAGYNVAVELEVLQDNSGRIRGARWRSILAGQQNEIYGLFGSVPLIKD